jgi:glutaconate CoA-transferase subunit A
MKEKVMSLAEAARLIKSGSTLAVGGFALSMHPMGLIHQLIRENVKDLTIMGFSQGIDADVLAGAGCLKRVESPSVTLEMFGLAPNFRRAVEQGQVEVRDYTETTIMARFYAGSMGLTFIPSPAMLGSDAAKHIPEVKDIECPLTGRKYHALPAATPDFTIIHAHAADVYGNVLFPPKTQSTYSFYSFHDQVFAWATKNVIATVEKIVDHEEVLANSWTNLVPAFRTAAVVEVPFGAHPCAWPHLYEHDLDYIKAYVQASRTPEGFQKHLDTYVYGMKDHEEYLNAIGGIGKLMRLRTSGGISL